MGGPSSPGRPPPARHPGPPSSGRRPGHRGRGGPGRPFLPPGDRHRGSRLACWPVVSRERSPGV